MVHIQFLVERFLERRTVQENREDVDVLEVQVDEGGKQIRRGE